MRRFELLRWNSFFLVIVFLALFYLVAYSFFVRRPQQEVVKIFFADRITAAHRYLIDKYNALNAGKVEISARTNERKSSRDHFGGRETALTCLPSTSSGCSALRNGVSRSEPIFPNRNSSVSSPTPCTRAITTAIWWPYLLIWCWE